jgi:hypothetical protein
MTLSPALRPMMLREKTAPIGPFTKPATARQFPTVWPTSIIAPAFVQAPRHGKAWNLRATRTSVGTVS